MRLDSNNIICLLLLDLRAMLTSHKNVHKSKVAVPSCEQSNLIFAEVLSAVIG